MQEFDQIQSLWQSHSVEVKISSDEMLAQSKKEVASIRAKSRLNILGMILSFAALVALLLFAEFESWTTLAGLSIIVILVAVYTYILYNDHKLIAQNDITEHPNAFLNKLKAYQVNKFRLYNKLYWVYIAALSIGVTFYFYEKLVEMSPFLQVILVVFTVIWMVLCATIFRKSYLKGEKERIALLIEKFERISKQFKDSQ
jgi:Ca2+/Na+ antiporter